MKHVKLLAMSALSMLFMISALPALADPAGGDTPASGAQQLAKTKQRVVIQVSDDNPKIWNQALNVVENLQQAYGKNNVVIEVVAFGNGIGMLKMDSEVGNRIPDLLSAGTTVYACENTMRSRKLDKDDMLPSVRFIPSGAVEIVSRQNQGWAVIRP